MDLSRFFSLSEMVHSDTAARENIPNDPTQTEIDCLHGLCGAVLDPLREAIGRAIKVNSGYRGPALNRRIGGATRSQHAEGKAADIQSPGMPVLELFKTIVRLGLPFDQVIYEAKSATAKWVHVSHNGPSNRGEIRVAEFGPDGRPRAYPMITAQEALARTEPTTRGGRGPVTLEYFEVGDEPEFGLVAPEPLLPAAPPKPKKQAKPRKRAKPKKRVVRRKTGKRAKVPAKKRTKTAPRKSATRKSAAKKAPARKSAAKKTAGRKSAAKKATRRQSAGRKAASRNSVRTAAKA